jgi:hypothetical protein
LDSWSPVSFVFVSERLRLEVKEAYMSYAKNINSTIFLREDTLLPPNLSIELEAFLPGWRVVRNLDRSALARNIEAAKWYFFYLAGEIRTTVLGRDRPRTLRRAVKHILAKRDDEKSNALEITEVVSRRVLGIPFTSVTAHSRHIQERVALAPAKDLVLSIPAIAPGSEVATKQLAAFVAGS